jgi:hypothetical protein
MTEPKLESIRGSNVRLHRQHAHLTASAIAEEEMADSGVKTPVTVFLALPSENALPRTEANGQRRSHGSSAHDARRFTEVK